MTDLRREDLIRLVTKVQKLRDDLHAAEDELDAALSSAPNARAPLAEGESITKAILRVVNAADQDGVDMDGIVKALGVGGDSRRRATLRMTLSSLAKRGRIVRVRQGHYRGKGR